MLIVFKYYSFHRRQIHLFTQKFSPPNLHYANSRSPLNQFLLNQLSRLTNPPTNTENYFLELLPWTHSSSFCFYQQNFQAYYRHTHLVYVIMLVINYVLKHQSHK